MIVLDTNVLSETMRPDPDPNAMEWLNAQSPASLWLTAITIAELRYNAAKLPRNQRRTALESLIDTYILDVFAGRIAPFDLSATTLFAERAADAAQEVRGFADAAIAAIALARGFAVATRNTAPFKAMGVDEVIDPWRFRAPAP